MIAAHAQGYPRLLGKSRDSRGHDPQGDPGGKVLVRKLLCSIALVLSKQPAYAQALISGLPSVSPSADTKEIPVVQDGVTKRMTPSRNSAILTGSANRWIQPQNFSASIQAPALTLSPYSGNRTSITFGDWQIGEDKAHNGSHDFYFYHALTKQIPIDLTTDGVPILQYVFNGNISGSAYNKTASPLTVNYVYGSTKPSTGTGIAIQCSNDIRQEGIPSSGRNEHACYYGYVRANGNWVHPAGQNYWLQDFNLLTPYQANVANRPDYIVGGSMRIMNMSAGADVIDSTHAGSFGSSVVAAPAPAADLASAGMPSMAMTYPISALYQATGWSGQNTVRDGYSTGATPAAVYAFRAGGGGGNIYTGNTTRSYFDIGYGVYDWANVGIDIHSRHPNGAGPGLRNAYATELGGAAIAGADSALLINTNAGSHYAAIKFGSEAPSYVIGTDLATNSGDNFFVYSSTLKGYPLELTPTVAILGVPARLPAQQFASLPTCDSNAAGTIAYVTDARAPIMAWHQEVTAGGGTNKAFIACNGSGWFAWDY
jgi:hypothetical protein